MRIGMDSAVLASQEQQKRLEVIANNLANVQTPGFKKDDVLFSDYIMQNTYVDTEQGVVAETGRDLDVAINGEGFFVVEGDQGPLYTRAGNLMINAQGTLVTQDGYPVLVDGAPITLESGDIRVDEGGRIFDGDTAVGSLDIVKFPDGVLMEKVTNQYLKPNQPDAPAVPADNYTVLQGSLENANFNLVEEMVQMIDTMRMFESYQKIIKTIDQSETNLMTKTSM